MNRRLAALLAVGALGLLLVAGLHRRRESPPDDSPASPPPAEAKQEPAPASAPGFVRGRVTGRYGTILCVPVRVLVDGTATAECWTDCEGRYRVEAPAGIEFDLVASPESWTELPPMRRRLTVAPAAEITEDFIFGASAGASGQVEGAAWEERVTLLAIRVEDYPPSPAGWAPVADLRCAPKLIAEADGAFTFEGLDPAANYRIAVDGYEWGLTRPVFLMAGDTGIRVPLERLLHFVVEAYDIEGGKALDRFTVSVVDRSGQIHDRIDGRDGRVVHRVRHPEQIPPDPPDLGDEEFLRRFKELTKKLRDGIDATDDLPSLTGNPLPPWKLLVEAEGYLGATAAPSGVRRIFLQRTREPNVLLLVEDDGGAPVDVELEGMFEAAEQPDGIADARVAKEAAGRFRAVLPTGAWRLRLSGGGVASAHVNVEVPASGVVTVEAPPLYLGGR